MITNLETVIKNKLSWLTKLKVVYDYFTTKTTWYPYASFELSNFEWNFLDVCTNLRTFEFNIVIVQQINEKMTRTSAKTILYKVLEDLITAFDWDQDLWDWTIVKWNVTNWDMWTFIEKEGSILALSVKLKLEIVTNAG